MEYKKLLASPKWQKKRLEILNRDNFTCKSCGNKDDQLHIHHTYYNFEIKPWEYPSESLVTLCNSCHQYITDAKSELKRKIDAFAKTKEALDNLDFAASILMFIDTESLEKEAKILYEKYILNAP